MGSHQVSLTLFIGTFNTHPPPSFFCISFAFVLHKHFISSDTAIDNVDKLRKTHGLMPYKTLSVILRFSNPISMVKGVLDLFLAQPFGGKSLLQRYEHDTQLDLQSSHFLSI